MDAQNAMRADTVRFLDALAPDGELTFQTFDDAKRGRKELSRIMHGNYWRNAAKLGELNAKGAGVFVMVNRGDGKGRKADNITAPRAVFLDLDGAPLAPVLAAPIRPPIVCETSPGKHHAYWPVTGIPPSDFRRAQQALAGHYGGDPKVCDLPRVMRLPGYVHGKGEPFTSRLLHCEPVMPWQWPELAQALGLPHGPVMTATDEAGTYGEGERNPALFRFACTLRDQGLDQADALRRLNVVNQDKCKPPLAGDEVAGIMASAWQGKAQGFAKLPYSLLDSEAFRTLSDAGKLVTVALIRRHNGANNGRLTLTRGEAMAFGLKKAKRTAGLEAAETAGLIERTERATSGRPGYRGTVDRFRLLFLP